LYSYIRGRLQDEAPRLLNVAAAVPELRVTEELKTIEASTSGKGSLLGRIALMIADGWFDEGKSDQQVRDELKRFGLVAQKTYANVTYAMNMKQPRRLGIPLRRGRQLPSQPADEEAREASLRWSRPAKCSAPNARLWPSWPAPPPC
jgi:monomeric isocitrate dehydrogenase